MGETANLTAEVVDAVSLERALLDAEVANKRAIEFAEQLIKRDEKIAKLEAEVVLLKRTLDPRRRLEHIFRRNHALYAVALRAKRMLRR